MSLPSYFITFLIPGKGYRFVDVWLYKDGIRRSLCDRVRDGFTVEVVRCLPNTGVTTIKLAQMKESRFEIVEVVVIGYKSKGKIFISVIEYLF